LLLPEGTPKPPDYKTRSTANSCSVRHGGSGALRDINGMLGVLEDSATIVLHDAHNDEVAQAIRLAVENRESGLIDCGMISTEKSFDAAHGVYWGGMRMLRFSRREPARRNG
jgi:hypothetical protein